jgi:hypothetical protein
MQLRLATAELNLIANILLEQLGTTTAAPASSSGGIQSDRGIGQSPRFFNDLLDKVLAGDMRLDSGELEAVADLLGAQKRKLAEGIAHPENAAQKIELQGKLQLLNRALERVDEARVMF